MLVETDIETGLRWGELVELRARDLRVDEGALIVSRVVIEIAAKFHPEGRRFLIKDYPKDKETRRIGLSTHLRDLLAAHTADLAPGDLLFPAPTRDHDTVRPAAPDPDHPEKPGRDLLGRTEPNAAGKTYRHGTITAYNMAPCRCGHCRAAYATYRAQRRATGADPSRATQPRPAGAPDPHLSRSWFRASIWEPALTHAGLGFHVRMHDLRHAHASWLLAGGGPSH